MDKLKKAGVVKGSRLRIDHQRLGFGVSSFIGINLHNARDYKKVIEKIGELPEILEAHYSTGDYNIFTKVVVRSVADLHRLLLDLQGIREIQSTSTIMILDTPIERDLKP